MEKLKDAGVRFLEQHHTKDPKFTHNYTIGLQIYSSIMEKLNSKTVYPDETQYIHGLI